MPHHDAWVWIGFTGLVLALLVLDLGVLKETIEKSGSWFSYKGERIGQGRDNARQFLKENPDIRIRLEAELRKTLGIPAPKSAEEPAAEPVALSPGASSTRRAAGR